MATTTPGGVMRGYWAIGRENSAMPPTSVITTLSTVAKIGRSMKKRDSMADGPSLLAVGGRALVRHGGHGCRRRLAQRRHGDGLRLDLQVGANLRQSADEHRVVGVQALKNHPQAVLLKRPGRDPAVLDLVLGIDHVDELEPLVRADGPV